MRHTVIGVVIAVAGWITAVQAAEYQNVKPLLL